MEDIMEKINLSFAVAEDSMRHLFYENLATQSGCHRRLQFPPKLLCCDVANPRFLACPNINVPSFVQFGILLTDAAFATVNRHASKVLDSQLSWRRMGEHSAIITLLCWLHFRWHLLHRCCCCFRPRYYILNDIIVLALVIEWIIRFLLYG